MALPCRSRYPSVPSLIRGIGARPHGCIAVGAGSFLSLILLRYPGFDVLVHHFYLFFHKLDVQLSAFPTLRLISVSRLFPFLKKWSGSRDCFHICLSSFFILSKRTYQLLTFPVKGLWTTFLNGLIVDLKLPSFLLEALMLKRSNNLFYLTMVLLIDSVFLFERYTCPTQFHLS